jgi:hypothetical protein
VIYELINVIIEESKWEVWKRRCLIRYENVWISDIGMIERLKKYLQYRKMVIQKMRVKRNKEKWIELFEKFVVNM